ncbi:MAG: hypothetical protein P8106_01740 [Gammaproteobacteria bacterium]|jgi:hypothetical protein
MPEPDDIRTVRVGCRGWQRVPWAGDYYPEDLPVDWRLAYYANEADCVLLPVAVWAGRAPDELAGWAGEVGERFRFFLEGDEQTPSPAVLAAFGRALGGWLATRPVDAAGASMTPCAVPCGRGWARGRGALVSIDGPDRDLRGWRARFEELRGWFGGFDEVAVILGPQASPRRARELRTLAELMAM